MLMFKKNLEIIISYTFFLIEYLARVSLVAFSGDLAIRAVGAAVSYDLLARDFCVLVARVENTTSSSTGKGRIRRRGYTH